MSKLFILLTLVSVLSTPTRTIGGVIEDVNDRTVIIHTDDGHIWEMEDAYYPKGALVTVTFDTRNTEDVTDDIILAVIER